MPLIQVFPETLVSIAEGSVMVPSMGIVDAVDQGFVDYTIGMGHAALYVPPEPPPEDTRKVKEK